MRCPCLVISDGFHCSATDAYYIPSAFELDEYCRSSRYRMCPFYQIQKKGRHFPQSGSRFGVRRAHLYPAREDTAKRF